MPRPAKRTHELIDLTGDDSDTGTNESHGKRPALVQHPQRNARNARETPVYPPGLGGTSVYSTAPQSSNALAASSQLVPVIEPDVLDLTQDSDEPDRELYGTFGACFVTECRSCIT